MELPQKYVFKNMKKLITLPRRFGQLPSIIES